MMNDNLCDMDLQDDVDKPTDDGESEFDESRITNSTKECSCCKISKDVCDFPKSVRNVGAVGKGVGSWCYSCCSQKAKDRRAKNPEKYRKANKRWRDGNPDTQVDIGLRRHYCISLSDYVSLLDKQRGECAICGVTAPSANGRKKHFSVDHDHVTGVVRGLLCSECNSGIGLLKDDASILKRAVRYIENGGVLRGIPSSFIPQSTSVVRTRAQQMMRERSGLCFQRAIREAIIEIEGIPTGTPVGMGSARVTPITKAQAAEIILKYEWLGEMGHPRACYGLWLPLGGVDTLAGAICFGTNAGTNAGNICGVDKSSEAMCLERGVCVHWAPKNAASWFVPRAVEMAAKEHGWRIFYAYSDPAAGEIGTIYQACNWIYLGVGPGHGATRERWKRPDGKSVSSRVLRARGLGAKEALAAGWSKEKVPARGKYVWFEGDSRMKKVYRGLLVHPVVPYPKRSPPISLPSSVPGDIVVQER